MLGQYFFQIKRHDFNVICFSYFHDDLYGKIYKLFTNKSLMDYFDSIYRYNSSFNDLQFSVFPSEEFSNFYRVTIKPHIDNYIDDEIFDD